MIVDGEAGPAATSPEVRTGSSALPCGQGRAFGLAPRGATPDGALLTSTPRSALERSGRLGADQLNPQLRRGSLVASAYSRSLTI